MNHQQRRHEADTVYEKLRDKGRSESTATWGRELKIYAMRLRSKIEVHMHRTSDFVDVNEFMAARLRDDPYNKTSRIMREYWNVVATLFGLLPGDEMLPPEDIKTYRLFKDVFGLANTAGSTTCAQ
ncbi:hypothetical protein [Rhodoblastus sp.]|uniref:hypothetical protein n=1 Tax=Rhodoblastus sp. TaxID=1962975 RepID=UPI0025EC7634|nr:hypothetical protein [Rhodoblastus sp.]